MAPRLSRSSTATQKDGNPRPSRKKASKTQKRSLNAFSIATAENPERSAVRKHRLGEVNDSLPQRKRQRQTSDDELEHDEEAERPRQRRNTRNNGQDSDLDEGSDSDGNTWQMGNVEDDDDSDIDSDEAFGESDDEKFEDFVFRGSSGGTRNKRKGNKKHSRQQELTLDEDDEEEDDEMDDDEDSLGEDAVDLATMLDDHSESEDGQQPAKKPSKRESKTQKEAEEGFTSDEDAPSEYSMSDAEGEIEDAQQLLRLQDLICSLNPDQASESTKRKGFDALEYTAPSDSAAINSEKLDLADLLPATASSKLKKAARILRDDIKSSKRNGVPTKIEVPLPKRQQDRLDRVAANEKAKQTLERWGDTVKQNRRAEHISFPLRHGDEVEPQGAVRFVPSTKPQNDLESTIQNILQESGLVTTNGKLDEERIRKFEELETNKLPVEEVEARRAELRKARELLFREEVRAKRIKKIKSKSYRRVHRKERERLEEKERALLIAEGVDLSEEEREANDRRRAEERMGTRHHESKWSKGVKKSGKAAWDEDARAGVTDMARKNEELRKRIHGKDTRNDSEEDSDVSSGNNDSDDDDVEEQEARKLQRQLSRVSGDPSGEIGDSRLSSMAFMRRAEAARKAQNDEDIRQMRKDLAGEESESKVDGDREMTTGRRKYGHSQALPMPGDAKKLRNEFEEVIERGSSADEGEDNDVKIISDNGNSKAKPRAPKEAPKRSKVQSSLSGNDLTASPAGNPWITGKKKDKKWQQSIVVPDILANPKKAPKTQKPGAEILSAPDADGFQTITYSNGDDGSENSDSEDDTESYMPYVVRNRELVQKAFAGDDAVADFEAEKKAIMEEEDEKVVDDTIPGWGTWVGEGLSKREQQRNNGKVLRKQDGIRPSDRKDAKLERVIMSEKRIKKNTKYLATQLPFPFESRQQYERSLRLPKGPEWTTKQTFQDGTKPRVLVKQGIILPPERPMA